jgi:hypothetical protein
VPKPFCIFKICAVCAGVSATTAVAETSFKIGTASYDFHSDAFLSLTESFVGGYTPSIQELWSGVELRDSDSPISNPAASSSVDVKLLASRSVGLEKQFGSPIRGVPMNVRGAFSVNSTNYSLPDGILPFIDPMVVSIYSLDVDLRANLAGQLAVLGDSEIRYAIGPGGRFSAAYSELNSALIAIKNNSIHSDFYLGFELLLTSRFGGSAITFREMARGQQEIQIAQTFEW